MIFNLNSLKVEQESAPDYSMHKWLSLCEDRKALLYVIFVYNDKESFIKVGRTCTSLKNRFQHLPYKYELLFALYKSPRHIYKKENEVHRLLKGRGFSLVPDIKFTGMSECYEISSIFFISELLDFHVDKKYFEKKVRNY